MHINEIIDQLKNILVIWKAKEDGLYLKDFDNEKEVAQFIETDPYFVKKVLEENQQSIVDYKAGKDRALGFLVGQAMKQTKGKANPRMLNQMFLEELNK